MDDLLQHLAAVVAGPAAASFWQRLSGEPDRLVVLARQFAGGDDQAAAETTLGLLVLDPLDPWELGHASRLAIAGAGLGSRFAAVRGLAAEYLAVEDPAALHGALAELVHDDDERMRALAWQRRVPA